MMKLETYAQALLEWCNIEKEATYDSLRRVCLMGEWLYAVTSEGALYLWKDGAWHHKALYNQTSGDL